jgi:DNA-binding GntR family transcriptional regulator
MLIKSGIQDRNRRMDENTMEAGRDTDLYLALRHAILRGDYAFGSRLKIDEIARRFGVSHMPVRKALTQLSGDRLVTLSRNRGASVRCVDLQTVGNIYDVVIPLESLLARRAAERADDGLVTMLMRVEAEFEDAAGRLDHATVVSINQRFHEIIGQQSGNPDAAEIVNRNQEMLRAIRRSYGFDATRLPGVVSDHRAMISAFRERDAESAAAIGAGHAAKARGDLIATIRRASRPT